MLLSLVLGVVHASAHGLHARRLLREVETDREVGGFETSEMGLGSRTLLGSSNDIDKLSKGSDTHIALYIIIPFVSAVVGYVTNVVALQMTFYPLEFTPSRLKFAQLEGQPFGLLGGWQGIIPSKAGKMAAILCDLMTTKLLVMAQLPGGRLRVAKDEGNGGGVLGTRRVASRRHRAGVFQRCSKTGDEGCG